jgi:hypothetical protein
MHRQRSNRKAAFLNCLKLPSVCVIVLNLTIGCAARTHVSDSTACADPVELTRHELYFGLQRPDSSIIRELEFGEFVNDVVAPLFADGLTIINAAGRYRLADGSEIEEPTKILILIYPDDNSVRQRIGDIIGRYRMQFGQESVGWVRTAASVCF